MNNIEYYKDELLTLQVVSRILNIEEKKDIKKILKKLNIKADIIKPTIIGSLCSYYKISCFLRDDVIREFNLINEELNKNHISSLLKKHIEMVIEIRKEEAEHTITIDPENEFELLKIKTKEKKEKQKRLDEENKIRVKNLYTTTKSVYYKYNRKTNPSPNKKKIKLSKEEEKKERVRINNNNRLKENKKFHISIKLRCGIASRLSSAVKNEKKLDGTINLLGCTIRECKKYLEEKFTEGMSWDNHGKNGWHIDHIIPCNAFDFRIKEAQEFCFNYKNLQPLWAKENLIKNGKVDLNYLIEIGINVEILKLKYRKQLLELINKTKKIL